MRSRAQFPNLLKTLFLLEHLPELLTFNNSLLVLGLVLKRHWSLARPIQAPRGDRSDGKASNALYPINFVVKHPNLVVVIVQGPP